MRVKVLRTGLNTYPDLTIVCGQSQFTDPLKRDTLLNPTVIIEILSPSTERYDRGMKFQHYRTIDSLKEYILIAQDKYHVERFLRHEQNEWVLTEAIGQEARMPIVSIGGELILQEIYEQVIFAPEVVFDITRDIPPDEVTM
jgi:Uma2 family endonuclease